VRRLSRFSWLQVSMLALIVVVIFVLIGEIHNRQLIHTRLSGDASSAYVVRFVARVDSMVADLSRRQKEGATE